MPSAPPAASVLSAGAYDTGAVGTGTRVWMIQAADLFVLCLHQLHCLDSEQTSASPLNILQDQDQTSNRFSTNRSKQRLLTRIRCVYSIHLVL